jgi:hypothetical protein
MKRRRRTDHTCLHPCKRVLLLRVCVPGSSHPQRADAGAHLALPLQCTPC